jgi:shikimate kinase
VGKPAYAGYEYQSAVTVWAGLELIVAKELAKAVTVELRSDEDFEAATKAPDAALVHGVVVTGAFEL